MDDIYTFKSSAFPKTTRVLSFRGVESISRPYSFEVFLSVPVEDARDIDLNGAIAKQATLEMHSDRANALVVQGALSAVRLVHAHSTYALFRILLEPKLTRLGLTQHSRLFTNQSVPDVIKAVLEENGLSASAGDYALQLTGTYSPEEHICQYQESDLDFLSRWMEHLGIYYFFQHGDEQEKLIITDGKSSQTDWPSAPIRYYPVLDTDSSTGAAIESFACNATSLPSSVKLKDYDHTKPTLDVSASVPVASNGHGEVSVYGARFFTPSDAKKFAQLRADEMLCRQLEHEASGTVPLRAGYNFSLEEHPIDTFNAKYVGTQVEHFGNLMGRSPDLAKRIPVRYRDVYRCDVRAIPENVQFRPERKTSWPRIYGFEQGAIDGEQDTDYAQIDEHGRYKVKFAFDESTLSGGKASTWVRMMQPHGGGPEGFHFPQRKNTEVVIAFLGGDPDRPVIAGVVNNAITPSAVTGSNNTKNVLQTGGNNRLEIEDQEGSQKISLSSPSANTFLKMGATDAGHEMTMHTDANALYDVTGNHDHNVGGNLTQLVKGNHDATTTGNHSVTTTGNQSVTTTGNRTTTTNGSHAAMIIGPYTVAKLDSHVGVTVGGTVDTHIGNTKTVTAGNATTLTVGNSTTTTVGNTTSTTTGNSSTTVNGPVTTVNNSNSSSETHGNATETFYGTKATFNLAATAEMTVGAAAESFIGFKRELNAGSFSMYSLGSTSEFFGGIHYEVHLGPHTEVHLLKKVEAPATIIEGLAVTIKTAVLSLGDGALNMKFTMVNIG